MASFEEGVSTLGDMFTKGPWWSEDKDWVRWRAYFYRFHGYSPEQAQMRALEVWRDLPVGSARTKPKSQDTWPTPFSGKRNPTR